VKITLSGDEQNHLPAFSALATARGNPAFIP